MQVHTLPARGARNPRGRDGPAQSCGCKPNGDARCCASAACGCSRAGLGCSVACNCRGFARVCANANAPLPKPAPRKEAAEARDAKKPKPAAAGPFAGAPRRLADVDDAERAAAAGSREAFLAALEAQRAAAVAVPAPAAAAPPPPPPAQPAAPAADNVVVIDLCDSDDDAPAAAAPPPKAAAPSKPAAPARRAAPAAGASALPRAPLSSYDPFNPPQYVPQGGFKTGGELRVREPARLRDLDGAWLAGLSACLDTGNEARRRRRIARRLRRSRARGARGPRVAPDATLTRALRAHAGLHAAVLRGGAARGAGGRAGRARRQLRRRALRRGPRRCRRRGRARAHHAHRVCAPTTRAGAAPSAALRCSHACSLSAPRCACADNVAGVTLAVTAGVTRAALGCDLLVSRFDILKLEEHGFRLSAKA